MGEHNTTNKYRKDYSLAMSLLEQELSFEISEEINKEIIEIIKECAKNENAQASRSLVQSQRRKS